MTVEGGKPWAITGPNGSGKSSLLALVAGYLSPSEGHIERFGLAWGPRYLFWQSAHVLPPPELQVQEVLRDFCRQKGLSQQALQGELSDIPRKAPLYALSSGMRQRFLLTLVLAAPAGLVLLDEPTAFLDPYHKAQVWARLQERIPDPNLLLLCATNDPEEAQLFPNQLSLPAYAA